MGGGNSKAHGGGRYAKTHPSSNSHSAQSHPVNKLASPRQDHPTHPTHHHQHGKKPAGGSSLFGCFTASSAVQPKKMKTIVLQANKQPSASSLPHQLLRRVSSLIMSRNNSTKSDDIQRNRENNFVEDFQEEMMANIKHDNNATPLVLTDVHHEHYPEGQHHHAHHAHHANHTAHASMDSLAHHPVAAHPKHTSSVSLKNTGGWNTTTVSEDHNDHHDHHDQHEAVPHTQAASEQPKTTTAPLSSANNTYKTASMKSNKAPVAVSSKANSTKQILSYQQVPIELMDSEANYSTEESIASSGFTTQHHHHHPLGHHNK